MLFVQFCGVKEKLVKCIVLFIGGISLIFFFQNLVQMVVNGNFNLGNMFWGCNFEINVEMVYGGLLGNLVGEVDVVVGLCQIISGFIVGSYYQFLFFCLCWINCGFVFQIMNVFLSGGVLLVVVLRNVIGFLLFYEVMDFYVIFMIYILIFMGIMIEMCNLLVDNVSIVFVFVFFVVFILFIVICLDGEVVLNWFIVSEERMDFFMLEFFVDGYVWNIVV